MQVVGTGLALAVSRVKTEAPDYPARLLPLARLALAIAVRFACAGFAVDHVCRPAPQTYEK